MQGRHMPVCHGCPPVIELPDHHYLYLRFYRYEASHDQQDEALLLRSWSNGGSDPIMFLQDTNCLLGQSPRFYDFPFLCHISNKLTPLFSLLEASFKRDGINVLRVGAGFF